MSTSHQILLDDIIGELRKRQRALEPGELIELMEKRGNKRSDIRDAAISGLDRGSLDLDINMHIVAKQ